MSIKLSNNAHANNITTQFIRAFAIELSDNQQVFFPGRPVIGTVALLLKSSIQVNRVRVRLFGRAKSTIKHYDRQQDKWKTYKEEEIYVDDAKSVFGALESVKEVSDGHIMEKGRHDFKFHFNLPNAKLPSSYEGIDGNNIRYFIEAWIDMNTKADPCIRKAFTVLEYIDCNLLDRRTPYPSTDAEKYLCCCFWRTGPLRLTGSIERKAYCPGENIVIPFVEVENNTSLNMEALKIKLVQSILYKARGRRSKGEKMYANKKLHPIAPHGNLTLTNQTIAIPAIPPTINCRPIIISYYVMIYVDVPRAFDLKLTFPIEIATIPLQRTRSIIHSLSFSRHAYADSPRSTTPPARSSITDINGELHKTVIRVQSAYKKDEPKESDVKSEAETTLTKVETNEIEVPPDILLSYQPCVDGAVSLRDENETDSVISSTNEQQFVPYYVFVNKPDLIRNDKQTEE